MNTIEELLLAISLASMWNMIGGSGISVGRSSAIDAEKRVIYIMLRIGDAARAARQLAIAERQTRLSTTRKKLKKEPNKGLNREEPNT
jgi:uncharacterized protein with von Willebrand factor type A (vWA) domain